MRYGYFHSLNNYVVNFDMTSSDYSKLVIIETTDPTDMRLYCLAQNPCYRNCMTAKGYFQSHMLDYYLGTGMEMPTTPDISIIPKAVG